jgi:hypothetical protein
VVVVVVVVDLAGWVVAEVVVELEGLLGMVTCGAPTPCPQPTRHTIEMANNPPNTRRRCIT